MGDLPWAQPMSPEEVVLTVVGTSAVFLSLVVAGALALGRWG